MAAYITLDEVEGVIRTTRDAVLVRFKDLREIWIPRSVCEDGQSLSEGGKDVVVKVWFAEREGLD